MTGFLPRKARAMLQGTGHEFPNPARATLPAAELKTGAVIRRLLRDYVSGEWGLLALAIFCMLIASAAMCGAATAGELGSKIHFPAP